MQNAFRFWKCVFIRRMRFIRRKHLSFKNAFMGLNEFKFWICIYGCKMYLNSGNAFKVAKCIFTTTKKCIFYWQANYTSDTFARRRMHFHT